MSPCRLTNHIEICQWDNHLQFLSRLAVQHPLQDQIDGPRDVLLEQPLQILLLCLASPGVDPLLPEGHVAEVLGVDEDHTAARDGGGGGVLKVRHLMAGKNKRGFSEENKTKVMMKVRHLTGTIKRGFNEEPTTEMDKIGLCLLICNKYIVWSEQRKIY